MAIAKSIIEFALTADANGLIGPIQKARGEFTSLEQSAGKAAKSTETGFAAMGDRLQGLGNKMMGVGAAMTVATLPLAAALKSGTSALMEAEKRAAQTNAVLQSTGQVAGVTAEHVGDLASSLRDMSGVSGGAIREGENMLLTFTNIRNAAGQGRDVFDRTTRAALDMSVAMGTDMKTAAMQLGKALNDPVGGLTRLQRVGVQFSEQQKQQIQNFVRMGDVASAQGVILDEVAREFGGSAKAFGETTAGQMAKAEAAFTQVKMSLASGLAPALSAIASVLGSVASGFNHLDSGTKTVISSVALFAVALGPLATLAGGVIKGMKGIGAAVDAVKVKFASLQESGGILNALKNNIGGIAAGFATAGAAIGIGILIDKVQKMDAATKSSEQTTLKAIAGQITSIDDLQRAYDQTGRHLDDLHAKKNKIEDMQKGLAAKGIGFGDPFGGAAHDEIQQIGEAEKAYTDLGSRIDHVNSVLGTLQQQTGMSREELTQMARVLNYDITQQDQATKFQHVAEAIDEVAKASGLTRDQVVDLSRTFGVDLTEDTATAAAQLERLAQGFGSTASALPFTTEELDGFAQKLGINLKEGGDDAANTLQNFARWAHQAGYDSQVASGQVSALQSAVNATIMPWLNQQQAVTSYQQALDQLPAQIKRITDANYEGLTSEEAANARRHDAEALMGQMAQQTVSAYLAQYQLLGANAQTAEGQAVLNGVLGQGEDSLDRIAARFGITREEAAKYKQQLDNIPGLVKTTIDADTNPANRKLSELERRMKSFYGTFGLPAPVPPGARGGIIEDGVAHFARGGMFDRATAIVGEGKGREWVIPEDPAYRGRALGLWHQAGAALMASGGVVGGDGAAAPMPVAAPVLAAGPDESVPVLLQIRDLLAQMAAAGPPTAAAQLAPAPTPDLGGGGGGGGGGAPGAPAGAGDAAASTDALTTATSTYTAAAALATTTVQTFDAQMMQAATATLPTATAATQMGDVATQSATASFAGQLPVQAAWQAQLTVSRAAVDMLTAAVQTLIGRMQALDATQVALHVDHSQVEVAASSIGSLAGSIQGALSSLGLSTNALTQWLGVVLALPAGVLAGAVGAESGGVVGKVGAGMKGHTPTLVMEGSRTHDEYVIPTDPKHRSNALNLLGGLHTDLGIDRMASGGVVGKVGAAISATTAGALQSQWGGTATSAPGSLGSATAGTLMAAAAFNAGGGGSQQMVSFAMAQSGDAYVWGAEGPDAWDCSGLVLGAAAAAGLPGLPHYSGSIYDMSQHISPGEAMGIPGAILWHPGHIAISRGDGQTIEARGKAYGVGSWPAEGRFTGGGLLPFPGASGSVSDSLPSKWQPVGKFISDRFRAAGIGVGPSVGGEDGEAGGGQFSGKISTFGGPNDPSAMGGMAYDGTTLDAYAAGVPYAAMRLAPHGEIPLAPRSWISINKGAAATRAQLLDWGPAAWTGRIVDVAPYVADAIGAATDDTVGVTGLAAGGVIPAGKYDAGGYLPEGLSLAFNGTGAPEPVGHHLAEPSIVVNVTIEGSVTSESDLVDKITDAIRAKTRRGFVGVG